jgi:hypothetical protein
MDLLARKGGAPRPRGLTFFYSACGLALRAVLRTFTSLCEDVGRQKKVSKEKAITLFAEPVDVAGGFGLRLGLLTAVRS